MQHNPGWVLYGAIGTLVFFLNVFGLVVGFRNGTIRITSDDDTPETRAYERWMLWQFFSGGFAQAVVWPLFIPLFFKQIRDALEGGVTVVTARAPSKDRLSAVPREDIVPVLKSLGDWRTEHGSRLGNGPVALALVNGFAQEGREFYRDSSAKEASRLLVIHLKQTLDYIEQVRNQSEAG